MKILFLGDCVGRSGRDGLALHLKEIARRLSPDCIILNGENAAAGFGITAALAKEFFALNIDVITTGNHVWDRKEVIPYIDSESRLLRPHNFPAGTPGTGVKMITAKNGDNILIINIMGRLFMKPLDDPFQVIEKVLSKVRLGDSVKAIVIDFHAEASSEKMAMGHFCDGRVSLVVGTHTHVPTADAQILPFGTAYQTDAGMCGDYNSVIGMKTQESLHRFIKATPGEPMTPAVNAATICGVFVQTDQHTGLATSIEAIRIGGKLKEYWPIL